MSYAGPSSKPNSAANVRSPDEGEASRPRSAALRAANWPSRSARGEGRQAAVFAAGLVVGLAIGAGVALLLAPDSGAHTRRALIRRGRRVTRRGRDAWDDLRDEFRAAVRNRKQAWRQRRDARRESATAE
jgi:gas vesicle protein